jgi:hypothetical protein
MFGTEMKVGEHVGSLTISGHDDAQQLHTAARGRSRRGGQYFREDRVVDAAILKRANAAMATDQFESFHRDDGIIAAADLRGLVRPKRTAFLGVRRDAGTADAVGVMRFTGRAKRRTVSTPRRDEREGCTSIPSKASRTP